MTATARVPDRAAGPPPALPRLLDGVDGDGDGGLEDHLSRWGRPPLPRHRSDAAGLLGAVEASGLTGRGGAGFPVAAKWRAVLDAGRHPVVVANGAEGEPASGKDAFLLSRLPHLVLDGATLAAAAVGASRVVAYVPGPLVPRVTSAVAARRRWSLDPVAVEVVAAPDTFVAGQESAAVRAVGGGPALPSFTGLVPVRRRGVDRRPTLVHNVETLAHLAQVARFGSRWFRSLGTPAAPGTTLLTVTGHWPGPRVVEAVPGTRLGDAVGLGADRVRSCPGVLLGGYGGGWLPAPAAAALPLTEDDARRQGVTLGAGVVVLLPRHACPLAETARAVRYLEGEGAGQCGPCVHGLADLTVATEALAARPGLLRRSTRPLLEVCELIEGRGACRHPDGAARLVRSALAAFPDHVRAHLVHGPCPGVAAPTALPGIGAVTGAGAVDPAGRPGRGR